LDIFEYLRGLSNVTSAELSAPTMHMVMDRDYSHHIEEITVQSLYLIPGFVIPYNLPD
jgi:hypothetical protein